MRILLLSAEYPPDRGGVGDYTRCLAQALLQRGLDVVVLTGRPPAGSPAELPSADQAPGEPLVLRRISSWGWGLAAEVRAVLRELSPALLHIQYQTGAYGMHPAVNLLPARLWREQLGLVLTCHDLYLPYLFPKAGLLRRWVTTQLLQRCDALVVTNADDRLRLLSSGSPDPQRYLARRPISRPMELIPIGSNIAPQLPANYNRHQLRDELGCEPGTVLLAYFGLLGQSKGADLLVEALARLPEFFQLLIIGGEATAPEDRRYAIEVMDRILQLDLLNRVSITGHLSAQQVSAHLAAADMAVLPYRDGASYRRGSLLAALAHGLPTITTAPALPLEPPLEQAALLVPPADAEALGQAIAVLSRDAQLRSRLSLQGPELARSFNWSTIAQRHEALYRLVLASRSDQGSGGGHQRVGDPPPGASAPPSV